MFKYFKRTIQPQAMVMDRAGLIEHHRESILTRLARIKEVTSYKNTAAHVDKAEHASLVSGAGFIVAGGIWGDLMVNMMNKMTDLANQGVIASSDYVNHMLNASHDMIRPDNFHIIAGSAAAVGVVGLVKAAYHTLNEKRAYSISNADWKEIGKSRHELSELGANMFPENELPAPG